MSDNESSPWMTQCPMCGSEIPLNATRCWLCGEDQPRSTTRNGPRPFDSQADQVLKLVSSIVILLAVGLVWLSVAVEEPGVGILLLLILIAPIIRTTYVMNQRAQRQKGTSKIEMTFMFSVSLLMTLILLTIVGVVAFLSFCVTCLTAGSITGGSGMEFAVVLGWVAALATVGGLVWLLWKPVVSRRIDRDIEKD